MIFNKTTKEGYEILPSGRIRVPEKEPELEKKTFWIRISKKWWHKELKDLNPIERCLLIELILYKNKEGMAWPSLRRLARELNISVNTARSHLPVLEKKGFIKMERSKTNQKWYYKVYQF